MKTLDLKKEFKQLYTQASGKISILDIPALNFLAIDGNGDPNTSPEYTAALEALYAVAFGLKFFIKKRSKNPVDYPVMPLEGLWWVPDMREFDVNKKGNWQWRMMIMQPSVVDEELLQSMKGEVDRKKHLPSVSRLQLIRYDEGKAAQILHVGPYATEGPTIRKLHDFIVEQEYERDGHHHEIYLGDPRKTEPSRLKTIIRQSVRK
jgi:hypothetical protein